LLVVLVTCFEVDVAEPEALESAEPIDCPPRIHSLDIGSVVEALVRIAERYPAGLGE